MTPHGLVTGCGPVRGGLGDVVSRSDAFNWSISKIADFMGMDRKTVSRRISDSGLAPAGERGGYPVYAAREVVEMLLRPKSAAAGSKDWDEFPEARKNWWQSENERLKYEVAVGQMIPQDEVARALAFMAKTFAASLDSLPDVLERDAGIPPENRATIQAVCDSARERAYESLIQFKLESEDDDGTDG